MLCPCFSFFDFTSYFPVFDNRPCNKLRKHGQISPEIRKRPFCFNIAAVYVYQIRYALECVKADSHRKQQIPRVNQLPFGSPQSRQSVDVFKNKICIFKYAQPRQIIYYPQNKDSSAAPLLHPFFDGLACKEIDCRRQHQKCRILRLVPCPCRIKNYTPRQNCKISPLLRKYKIDCQKQRQKNKNKL